MKIINLLLFLSLTTTPFFSSLDACFGRAHKRQSLLPLVQEDVDGESSSWLSTAFKKVRQKVVSVLPTTKRSQLLLSAVVGAAIVAYLMLHGEDPTPILEQCPVLQEDFLSLMGYGTEQCSLVAEGALTLVTQAVEEFSPSPDQIYQTALTVWQSCRCSISPWVEIACECSGLK